MSRLDVSSSPVKLPYEQTVEEVMVALGTHTQAGLTCHEAQERQQRFGLNELRAGIKVPAWRRFLLQLRDLQIYLLLGAAAVAAFVSQLERGSGVPYV